jgi:ribosomal protein S18 acetylase RimI-like enzyme
MSQVTSIRELRDDEIQSATGLIARGMRDNPLHIHAFGRDAGARVERLRRMFDVALPILLKKGVLLGAFDGAVLIGIAGMVSSDKCQPTSSEKVELLPRLIPAIGFGALMRVRRWMKAWGTRDLEEDHWHLGPVAVDAHLQGKGIGSRLMVEYCARLDRIDAVGYLETDKPNNVPFYQKFGFQTIADTSHSVQRCGTPL